jgi:hypothetical protein
VSLLWTFLICLAALAAVLTIVDVVRRHYPAAKTVGWIALVVILPFVGALIYWIARKPTRQEADQAYLVEAERRQAAQHSRFDGF